MHVASSLCSRILIRYGKQYSYYRFALIRISGSVYFRSRARTRTKLFVAGDHDSSYVQRARCRPALMNDDEFMQHTDLLAANI